jgi:hypothetical protein
MEMQRVGFQIVVGFAGHESGLPLGWGGDIGLGREGSQQRS